ncbi:ABC transporter ATP-binding protein [Chondromyces apiculatus]|uniref:Transport ATP-binding protein CydD n=1 Tax=Chondromyces apiculatus DSM 436 TaxID=1192034 RepID=A0A017TG65_9BACT|nr:ABC transporter ATP-binding protein [Chondromyces apiculatus]EYF08293.1 Transport ATP-binding protein CydD [Chondromyces apiculatus DSM 436]
MSGSAVAEVGGAGAAGVAVGRREPAPSAGCEGGASQGDASAGSAGDVRGLSGLLRLLGSQAGLVSASALASVLGVAVGLVPFYCVARMATAIYATPARLDEVQSLAFVVLGALGGRVLFNALATVLAHVAAFRVLHDLRLRLARKLGGVPLSFFASRTTGELKRTMMDDVAQVESFIAHHFPDGVAAIAVPVLVTIALLSVDWRMALASVAVMPLAIGAMASSMRGMDEMHRKWFALQDRTNASMLEFLRGIHVVKSFGLTAQRFGDLSRSIEEGLAWMVSFMRTNGRGYGTFAALIGSSLVVLIPVGGLLHVTGKLSLQDLVLFLVLGPQLTLSMMRLMFAWGNVQRIEEGNARIMVVLLAPDLVARGGTKLPAHHGIAFREVSFSYGEEERGKAKEALSRVSFEVEAGKVTALVGPSGAGKTTLARLVPRLWEATSGRVEVGGVDVKEMPLDVLLGKVSVVFQEVFLFHGSVRENLRLAKPDATEAEIVQACKAARADEFVLRLPMGYGTPLGERGARLSGGEKQRLSIARALLKDAPILVLDEATAFADAENEALIQEALSALCQGRTVLVIAHRLASVASADKLVVLDEGEVRDQGTHEELLGRCALYQELFAHQSEAAAWVLSTEGSAADAGGAA